MRKSTWVRRQKYRRKSYPCKDESLKRKTDPPPFSLSYVKCPVGFWDSRFFLPCAIPTGPSASFVPLGVWVIRTNLEVDL